MVERIERKEPTLRVRDSIRPGDTSVTPEYVRWTQMMALNLRKATEIDADGGDDRSEANVATEA
jgi:hypothetical protein